MAKSTRKPNAAFMKPVTPDVRERTRTLVKEDPHTVKAGRFTLELPPAVMSILERHEKLGGLATRRDAIISAITISEWALGHVLRGHSIAAVDKESRQFTELCVPMLEIAKTSRLLEQGNSRR